MNCTGQFAIASRNNASNNKSSSVFSLDVSLSAPIYVCITCDFCSALDMLSIPNVTISSLIEAFPNELHYLLHHTHICDRIAVKG